MYVCKYGREIGPEQTREVTRIMYCRSDANTNKKGKGSKNLGYVAPMVATHVRCATSVRHIYLIIYHNILYIIL